MGRKAHNSTWERGIRFRGKTYEGPTDLYQEAEPRPAVCLATLTGRLFRLRKEGRLDERSIEEAVCLSVSEYRAKYGARKSWAVVDGRRVSLGDHYAASKERAQVSYSNFWQRVQRLRRSRMLDEGSLEAALSMSAADWRSFHGGGRHRSFQYNGDEYPALFGRRFHSFAAFLKTIGRYSERATVWSRLKAGWDLDAALIEPVINEVSRFGRVYKVTRLRTGEVYVGLTIMSLEGRWAHHVATARNGGAGKLSRAISEDGAKGFVFEVLEDGIEGAESLQMRERFWVDALAARGPKGLNTRPGGGLGLRRGKRTEYKGEAFDSITEASLEISRRLEIAPHVVASRLREGKPIPLKARRHSRHPKAGSALFRRWLHLKRRHPGKVDPSWVEDFDAFEADVTPSQADGLELVRSDDSRLWGPANFEWVSTAEKVARTHGRVVVVHGRRFKTLKAVAEAHGIEVSTLKYRLNKGMTPEQAVAVPLEAIPEPA